MNWSLLGFSSAKQMFNVHPLFVHFPIALLPASLLLYFLGVVRKNRSFLAAGRACLYLALAGAVAALATGLIAEDRIPHNETIHVLMQTHKTVAWGFLVLTAIVAAWSFFQSDQRPKGAWAFLAALGLSFVLVMQTAELGGRMVYIEGAAVKPAVAVITKGEEEESGHAHEPDEEAEHGHHHHDHDEDDHH